jgi:hypothetical protein
MVGTTSYFLIDSLKALDKENLLTMLNGRIIGSEHMLGNELLTNTEL